LRGWDFFKRKINKRIATEGREGVDSGSGKQSPKARLANAGRTPSLRKREGEKARGLTTLTQGPSTKRVLQILILTTRRYGRKLGVPSFYKGREGEKMKRLGSARRN